MDAAPMILASKRALTPQKLGAASGKSRAARWPAKFGHLFQGKEVQAAFDIDRNQAGVFVPIFCVTGKTWFMGGLVRENRMNFAVGLGA